MGARASARQWAVGIVISAACLWIALASVDVGVLTASLRTANYWWLLPFPVVCTALNIVRAEIWRRLLRKRVGSAEAFWAYSVGFLVNNLFPLRVGEAARVLALAAKSQLPVMEVAAAAGLERVLDLIAILVIVAMVLPFVTHSADVERAAVWSVVLVVFVVAGVAVGVTARRRLEHILSAVGHAILPARMVDALLIRFRDLTGGMTVATEPRLLVPVIGGCSVVWMLTVFLQWTVMRAFQPQAGLVDASTMVAVVGIGGAIPAAPGAIGTFQWIGQQALTLPFPELYPPPLALAIAFVTHACSYLFSTLLGALGVWRLGLRARIPGAQPPD